MKPPAPPPAHPKQAQRRPWQRVSLKQLQSLKQWRTVQRELHQHRLECAVWEAVLTVWILGWTGWLPTIALHLEPLLPMCMMGILAPQLYIYARARAHARGQLRGDWLDLLD